MTSPAPERETIRPKSKGRAALRSWSRSARTTVMLATAFGVLASVMTILLAGSLSFGVASAIAGQGSLWLPIGLSALAGRALCGWLSEHFAAAAGLKLVAAARAAILSRVEAAGAELFMGAAAGARVSQIVDRTSLLAGWTARWLPGVRSAAITPVLILIVILTQSWVAAASLAIAVLVMPLFLSLTIANTRSAASAQQAALDALQGVFQVRTEHAGLIRAFRAINRESETVRVAADRLRQGTMRILRRAFLTSAVLDFFSALSIALLAVYVGFKLLGLFPFDTGEVITLQEGMMVLILAPEFFLPIRRMSTLHHDSADALAAADELEAWLTAAPCARRRLPRRTSAPVISFQDVGLRMGYARIISALSFEALPGAITVLSGPSGSGKTSTLLCLLGLAQVEAGEIRIDDVPLAQGDSLALSVAYIRQAPWLFEGTLAANLRVAAPDASDDLLREALVSVGAERLIAPEQGGLLRQIFRGGQGLSGGERQRIAVARALLADAPVWLLDEPTAHLDADAEAEILQLLRREAVGRTILVATHEDAVRRIADRIVILPLRESLAA